MSKKPHPKVPKPICGSELNALKLLSLPGGGWCESCIGDWKIGRLPNFVCNCPDRGFDTEDISTVDGDRATSCGRSEVPVLGSENPVVSPKSDFNTQRPKLRVRFAENPQKKVAPNTVPIDDWSEVPVLGPKTPVVSSKADVESRGSERFAEDPQKEVPHDAILCPSCGVPINGWDSKSDPGKVLCGAVGVDGRKCRNDISNALVTVTV